MYWSYVRWLITWFCMLFWCYCTRKIGAVSQTIFRTVAAILRMCSEHERFVAMWGSWPSRSQSHSKRYIYYMGQVVISLISRIMYIHHYAVVQQRWYGIRAWGWHQLTEHLTIYYICLRGSSKLSVCEIILCFNHTHGTPTSHCIDTLPPCTPVTPHVHIYMYIHIYSCACVNVQ